MKLREQPGLCNEALVVNAQRASSDVLAKLEQEGASFNGLDPPLGLLKHRSANIGFPQPRLERKKRLIRNLISNEMTFKWECSITPSLPLSNFLSQIPQPCELPLIQCKKLIKLKFISTNWLSVNMPSVVIKTSKKGLFCESLIQCAKEAFYRAFSQMSLHLCYSPSN